MFARLVLGIIAIGVLLSTAASLLGSAEPEEPARFFTDSRGVALGGNDPVAYFTEGKAVPGELSIATRYQGATFRFASQHHRRAFLIDPDAYAPQFAGACAWAVSEGVMAMANGDHFDVVDGRLYLYLNGETQRRFGERRAHRIAAARQNWPTVLADWARDGERSPSPARPAAAITATGGGSPPAAGGAGLGWTVAAGRR